MSADDEQGHAPPPAPPRPSSLRWRVLLVLTLAALVPTLVVGALAIAMRQYAAMNPIAFRRDPMSWDDYLADRWIVWPLRRSDICLITDGAVCLLLLWMSFGLGVQSGWVPLAFLSGGSAISST